MIHAPVNNQVFVYGNKQILANNNRVLVNNLVLVNNYKQILANNQVLIKIRYS